jgi:transposase
MRTRIMNQLQALAMNEGYRWKKKLFREQGWAQLEKLSLAPWASRRRQELLELLDRMNPTIEELTAAVKALVGSSGLVPIRSGREFPCKERLR